MRAEDVKLCAEYGTDILGFVAEYPHPVPWNLTRAEAKPLIEAVPKDKKTCIVTGGDYEKIVSLALFLKPDYIQLHDGESLETTKRLKETLSPSGILLIKTLFPNTENLIETAQEFDKLGVSALLFDPRTPENAKKGGSADVNAFLQLKAAVSCPVILAGGITPENVLGLIAPADPEIIDLMTGVEESYGVKSADKLAALFNALPFRAE
jgi:phosphoribosylanthranilate isomerase